MIKVGLPSLTILTNLCIKMTFQGNYYKCILHMQLEYINIHPIQRLAPAFLDSSKQCLFPFVYTNLDQINIYKASPFMTVFSGKEVPHLLMVENQNEVSGYFWPPLFTSIIDGRKKMGKKCTCSNFVVEK